MPSTMSILQTLRTIFNARSGPDVSSIGGLAAAMADHDGYTREAALRRAAELASPELVPAIAERLNDWVPQVRTQAREVLLGMLPSLDQEQALRLLPAVHHLYQTGRADHSAWIAAFERALIEHTGPQAIIERLLDPDVHLARACCKLVETYRLAPPEAVIARLLPATRDIVLAKQAVEAIFDLPEPAREPLFRQALASGFGMVRAIALRPVLSEVSVENDALAIRMASDLQSWVRLIASAYLKRRGMDVAAILADALRTDGANSTRLRACLAGLAEQGSIDRLDLVRDHTRHRMARVQLAAYAAWLRLEPSRRDEIALDALRSPHRRVRKFVLQLVREEGAYIETQTALSLMAVHDDVDMMFALSRREPWSWLDLILQMAPRAGQDAALRGRLERELDEWLQDSARMYVKPSPAQRALFESGEAIRTFAELLKTDAPSMARRLRFELGEA